VQESLQKVIWMGLLSMETKQHTSLLEWKVKMLQILPKNASIIFETRPTICISLPSEEKTK
jgi:hypothetical protein